MAAADLVVVVGVFRESRRVGEKVAERDALLARARELRQQLGHRLVEGEQALLHELHDRRRREGLGHRGHREESVPGDAAQAAAHHDAPPRHERGRGRQRAIVDPPSQQAEGAFERRGIHADVFGLSVRQHTHPPRGA